MDIFLISLGNWAKYWIVFFKKAKANFVLHHSIRENERFKLVMILSSWELCVLRTPYEIAHIFYKLC